MYVCPFSLTRDSKTTSTEYLSHGEKHVPPTKRRPLACFRTHSPRMDAPNLKWMTCSVP
ncbi:hypothetical protein BDV28DRAFT_138215 [Aspergillus coremiiformis]|uniref:Uncharacterized protein n=1 Tax=Aspergillus coremiiformis TaxID=138285 RepID=A0A5N6YZT2_9EURO|nr:hypothetical protein BDV28DRAFT_138215 [Aspergillus coremiiformis]